jgi:hypothetical protein
MDRPRSRRRQRRAGRESHVSLGATREPRFGVAAEQTEQIAGRVHLCGKRLHLLRFVGLVQCARDCEELRHRFRCIQVVFERGNEFLGNLRRGACFGRYLDAAQCTVQAIEHAPGRLDRFRGPVERLAVMRTQQCQPDHFAGDRLDEIVHEQDVAE